MGGRYIGRFGKKALTVNLLHQTVEAYLQDMGVTSDLLVEDLFNPLQGARTSDDAPDPEVASSVVANVVFYLKTLRVPARRGRETTPTCAAPASSSSRTSAVPAVTCRPSRRASRTSRF